MFRSNASTQIHCRRTFLNKRHFDSLPKLSQVSSRTEVVPSSLVVFRGGDCTIVQRCFKTTACSRNCAKRIMDNGASKRTEFVIMLS